MAPSHSRQLLVWTFPTIAILLSYLWFKRKRIGVRSDPGGTSVDRQEDLIASELTKPVIEGNSVEVPKVVSSSTPEKKFSRSLSGVETAPIDIIIPRELRAVKSNPVVIPDEDLDFEIEKIKSMKNETFNRSRALNNSNTTTTNNNNNNNNEKSPYKENNNKTKSPAVVKKIETPKERKLDMVEKKSETTTTTAAAEKMAQDIVRVEKKLNNLKLGIRESATKKKGKSKGANKAAKGANSLSSGGSEHEELQRQSSERDSANHSPADVMLASPSLSSISDNHSEGSSDSGKGGSDVATPPSARTPAVDTLAVDEEVPVRVLFVCFVPHQLVGRLIGRHGCYVNEIKAKTKAHVVVKDHPTNDKVKICTIEGKQREIDNALRMIRDKFPQKRYPEFTLEPVTFAQPTAPVPVISDHLYLKLIEGINNDTILSCIITPGHLFLQQPTHPTFPNFNAMSDYLNTYYNNEESPLLPKPISENTVCVAHSLGLWYRALVLSTDEETDTSYVKFLDCGGYVYVENSNLRQIRGEFLTLPFQAVECCLADIRPVGDAENWAPEAYNHISELVRGGTLIYTQVVSYTEDGLPLVHCYITVSPREFVFLNEDLVNRGFAEWIQPRQTVTSEEVEGAVGGVEQ